MPIDPLALVQSAQDNRAIAEQALANVQAADDAARTAAAQQAAAEAASAPPRDPNAPCPCDGVFTPAQKALHAAGLSLKNPVGDASRGCANKLAGSLIKVNGLISAVNDPTNNLYPFLNMAGVGGGKLNSLLNSTQGMANAVGVLQAEADRLSDPTTLMTTLGTMNLFGKIGCALGIEGLDISVALQASSAGGINKIAAAVKAQVDLDAILDNALAGANLTDGANALSSGIDGVMGGMGSAAGGINDVVVAGQVAMAEAMAKVAEFTQVNFFANLVGDSTDPCNILAVDVTANILSPEFKRYADNALASVKSPTTIGAGFR